MEPQLSPVVGWEVWPSPNPASGEGAWRRPDPGMEGRMGQGGVAWPQPATQGFGFEVFRIWQGGRVAVLTDTAPMGQILSSPGTELLKI